MYKLRMRIVCVLATICMLVGSLQLPGNVRIVHASTTSDNVLLDYDFENKTTEDFMTDWSINSGYHNASAAIEIETINDNNVLVLNQSKIESTDTKGNLNIRKRFAEGYDKVVLSYSVATKDGSGVLYGPSLISHSTSTTRAVEVYINGKIFKDRYNSEGDIQVKSGCAAMTWHTVKVVYEKVSEENSYKYSVY